MWWTDKLLFIIILIITKASPPALTSPETFSSNSHRDVAVYAVGFGEETEVLVGNVVGATHWVAVFFRALPFTPAVLLTGYW